MGNFNRRAFLACGLLGTQTLLAACGGGGGGETEAVPAAAAPVMPGTPSAPASLPPEWQIGLPLTFASGTVSSIDLRKTLPVGIAPGGVFSLGSASTLLPAGVTLAANGVLTVAADAVVNVTVGVVFAYSEP